MRAEVWGDVNFAIPKYRASGDWHCAIWMFDQSNLATRFRWFSSAAGKKKPPARKAEGSQQDQRAERDQGEMYDH